MKHFKELSDSNLHTEWNVIEKSIDDDQYRLNRDSLILEFMHQLGDIKNTKRIYWHRPYSIKHVIEHWANNKQGTRPYISRDKVVAMAIFKGIPVEINPNNHNETLIGLWMTPTQYSNLYYNIANHGAQDLVWAMKCRPDQYQYQTYKKLRREEYGY